MLFGALFVHYSGPSALLSSLLDQSLLSSSSRGNLKVANSGVDLQFWPDLSSSSASGVCEDRNPAGPRLWSVLTTCPLAVWLERPLGSGACVRLAQGALVTPSTIPTGGPEGRVANGAAVPEPGGAEELEAHGAAVTGLPDALVPAG